jgi:enamine deaminase RidA (YjgF/YER057c/UK114 family)
MIGKYLVFKPGSVGNTGDEWRQCLKQIIYKREAGFRLIKLNIFIDVPDYASYLKVAKEIGKTIKDAFDKQCPAFSITVAPPEKPWKVVVEAGYTDIDSSDVVTNICNSIPYVVCTTDAGKEVWAGGLGSGLYQTDTRKAAESAFNQMKAILEAEDMSFDDIIRQWNYIGNILEIKNDFQNYQVFNEVRSEFYHKYRTVHGYPSATGIGMKHGGVIIDFCAIKANEAVTVKPIDNPNQVNAYEYGQQVLKGMPIAGTTVKHPPQFERALLLSRKIKSTLFISGTASIIGQDTIGIDDIEKQTRVTIENISKLVDHKRFVQLVHGSDSEWGNFILVRVYIKNQESFPKVREICAELFPETTRVYIESDVCRDNLLVEIEAEFLINN